jgi:hypothetical protein
MMQEITLGAVVFLILKEMLGSLMISKRDGAKALLENTLALKGLQVEIAHLKVAIEMLPKIKLDVDAAHQKIRSIENKLGGSA